MGLPTLFERCGGFAKVRRIVAAFYDKVLETPSLEKYFAATDIRRLIDHQTKFVAMLMGGPAAISDEALRRAHAHLGITPEEFREMADLLQETLEDFGVGEADRLRVHEEIMRRAPLIVGAGASAAAGAYHDRA